MNKKKNEIQSNPFGFTAQNETTPESNDWNISYDDDQADESNAFNNSNSNNQQADDFFNAGNDNNNNVKQQKQKQNNQKSNTNNPFNQNTTTTNDNSFDMSGMIDLQGDNNINQQQQQQAFNQPQQQQQQQQQYGDGEEPPLLEDLGINIELIKRRMISVAKLQKCDEQFLVESDMSGPILLAFVLGIFMMLSGKLHFGYIYGFGICGTLCLYLILNWLAQHRQIELYNVLSILGYCLMPIVALAFFAIFIDLVGIFGGLLSVVAVGWATYTASTFFEEVLQLDHQKYLAAYPIFLFYFTFVLITILGDKKSE